MKVKYIGESFGAVSLTNGKIYECLGFDNGMLRVIDDGEDQTYACASSSAEHFSMHPCRGYDNIRNIDRQGRRDVVYPPFPVVPAGISLKVFPCP